MLPDGPIPPAHAVLEGIGWGDDVRHRIAPVLQDLNFRFAATIGTGSALHGHRGGDFMASLSFARDLF